MIIFPNYTTIKRDIVMSRLMVINLKTALETTIELSELSDRELLKHLCSTDDDATAFALFIERFWPDMEKECAKICAKRKIDTNIGTEIAHETFERVRKYKSFREEEIKLTDNRKAILVYLFRISVRLFNNYHAIQKREDVVHRTYFDDIVSNTKDSIDADDLKRKKDLSVNILKKLNHKEQRVLLTDLKYKRYQKYLPDDILETLAVELNIKKDTIRKIRERAIVKINKAIDEINRN
jgi:DNA-directed RNA polymerase specialized sigma24 family protein